MRHFLIILPTVIALILAEIHSLSEFSLINHDSVVYCGLATQGLNDNWRDDIHHQKRHSCHNTRNYKYFCATQQDFMVTRRQEA